MASNAFAGVGTKFQRWDGAAWQDIAEVNSIDGPGMTKDVLEVTSLDTDAGYNEFITGFAEGGTVTLDMNFTRETYELMKDDFESDVVQNYRIQLADYDSEPSTFTFGGLVIELPMGISADDKVTADVVIQVTSQVILENVAALQALELTFDDIANVPVADASSLSDWNTYFDLPTYGTPFTSVVVDGNVVKLYGGSGIHGRMSLFTNDIPMPQVSDYLISIVDNCNCIESLDMYALYQSSLERIHLPALLSCGYQFCLSIQSLQQVYIPLCTNLGGSVGSDLCFYENPGQTITLTIPSSLMTCNSGNPDGDIAYLQANNTVTITTV